ncbi:MAG: hypothetical protein QOE65_39 [Solirubrobacteraceae bacterium]|jgi:hypothetical protein|nr:hypothetical protein [Solirubrobacteraceae bacterium]
MSEPATPEEAAAEAARRARARQHPDAEFLEELGEDTRGGLARLHEWAVIDVEPDAVRSTRRGGAPVTRFKRFLARMLGQYHNEQNAQIGRFNVHLLGYVAQLEERVAELEERLRSQPPE